jgi:hypothetical protein
MVEVVIEVGVGAEVVVIVMIAMYLLLQNKLSPHDMIMETKMEKVVAHHHGRGHHIHAHHLINHVHHAIDMQHMNLVVIVGVIKLTLHQRRIRGRDRAPVIVIDEDDSVCVPFSLLPYCCYCHIHIMAIAIFPLGTQHASMRSETG